MYTYRKKWVFELGVFISFTGLTTLIGMITYSYFNYFSEAKMISESDFISLLIQSLTTYLIVNSGLFYFIKLNIKRISEGKHPV